MPLVRIDYAPGLPATHAAAISRGVHDALVRHFRIPPDDLFHVVTDGSTILHGAAFLGSHYSEAVVVIHITASRGRSVAQKQALYRTIADNLAEDPGLRRDDILIVLTENGREDWSFGGGVAQYVEAVPG